VNGAGAGATGVVAIIVVESKFAQGAWAVMVAIPLLVLGFYGIHRHYSKIARRLRAGLSAVAAAPPATNRVVLYVDEYDAALEEAVWYARQIAGDDFDAIHVPGKHSDPGILPRFRQLTGMQPDLDIVTPEDGRLEGVIEYLWALPRGESSFITMIVPELFRQRSLARAVRRPEFALKLRLLREPGVVVTDVPLLMAKSGVALPRNAACRVLVSGAHAATMRAANYAGTLGIPDTNAVFFAFDAEEAEQLRREWALKQMPVPLEIEEAPFRDIGDPLTAYVRGITADPEAVAVVVMPELVFSGVSRSLHNQRALYIKRLLLFEPRVILASVPYRLD
jgi:hypothetical protein